MALAVVAGMAVVARAESYSIVQLTDMENEQTIQVVSTTELRDLKKQLEAETKVFQKAKDLAAKEWAARIVAERKANDKNAPKTLPFPGAQLRGGREMRVLPRNYMNKDDADKAVQVMEEVAARKADNKKEREIKAGAGKLPKKLVDHDKELNLREAATFLKTKIDELTQAAATDAAKVKQP
ncbi:MAG: hypothetical protein WCL16_00520 [bacterium]